MSNRSYVYAVSFVYLFYVTSSHIGKIILIGRIGFLFTKCWKQKVAIPG